MSWFVMFLKLCVCVCACVCARVRVCPQTPTSFAGTLSPQGQIMVQASALQQGNVTLTTVNPTQVVSGTDLRQPLQEESY